MNSGNRRHLGITSIAILAMGLTGSFQAIAQSNQSAGTPPGAPVRIVGPLPLPVTGVSGTPVDPADIAKAFGIQDPVAFPLSFNSTVGSGVSFNVPANQRLIIEYAAGSCRVTHAEVAALTIKTSSATTIHAYVVNLPLTSATSDPPATGVFSHTVRIYVDPGWAVTLLPQQMGIVGNGFVTCNATLSGQLVDVP
jgi:hypothetical protein